MTLSTIALVLAGLLILGSFAYAGLRGAPWVPTRQYDLARLQKLAQIRNGHVFYDIGCGDGRILCAAAERGAIAHGFEVSLLPFLLAHIRRLLHKERKNIHIHFGDFWFKNFSDADIVYCFLMPEKYPDLETKFREELHPGAKVITYVWPMLTWEPIAVNRHAQAATLYMYRR